MIENEIVKDITKKLTKSKNIILKERLVRVRAI